MEPLCRPIFAAILPLAIVAGCGGQRAAEDDVPDAPGEPPPPSELGDAIPIEADATLLSVTGGRFLEKPQNGEQPLFFRRVVYLDGAGAELPGHPDAISFRLEFVGPAPAGAAFTLHRGTPPSPAAASGRPLVQTDSDTLPSWSVTLDREELFVDEVATAATENSVRQAVAGSSSLVTSSLTITHDSGAAQVFSMSSVAPTVDTVPDGAPDEQQTCPLRPRGLQDHGYKSNCGEGEGLLDALTDHNEARNIRSLTFHYSPEDLEARIELMAAEGSLVAHTGQSDIPDGARVIDVNDPDSICRDLVPNLTGTYDRFLPGKQNRHLRCDYTCAECQSLGEATTDENYLGYHEVSKASIAFRYIQYYTTAWLEDTGTRLFVNDAPRTVGSGHQHCVTYDDEPMTLSARNGTDTWDPIRWELDPDFSYAEGCPDEFPGSALPVDDTSNRCHYKLMLDCPGSAEVLREVFSSNERYHSNVFDGATISVSIGDGWCPQMDQVTSYYGTQVYNTAHQLSYIGWDRAWECSAARFENGSTCSVQPVFSAAGPSYKLNCYGLLRAVSTDGINWVPEETPYQVSECFTANISITGTLGSPP